MKKRIWAWCLALALTASLLSLPAGAAGDAVTRFSDVADRETTLAVETLRLMGVLDGYGDGTFRPDAQLTRAQFCKMAVYATAVQDQLGMYSTVTVFPDVKPSHWASAYVNMAAKGKSIISGYPDGRFYPDRTVTVGQAVTILLRLLGYGDKDIGGVWPTSYMAKGAQVGLTEGLSKNGNEPLKRGQAALLFLNLLRCNMKEGGAFTAALGTPLDNVMLVSSTAKGTDGKDNALQTAAGETYQLASGKTSNGALNGRRGTLIVDKRGKAVTFVPEAEGVSRSITLASHTTVQIVDSNGGKYAVKSSTKTFYNGEETRWGEVSSWLHTGTTMTLYLDTDGTVAYIFVGGGGDVREAVVVYENGSKAGFDSLAGGVSNYTIYKNGEVATAKDLRKYDTAIYSPSTNSIRVCDTRVSVYYEGCSPNPKEPVTVTAMGHQFDVLPTAMESLAKFKPGDQMTLLLTEGGQIAGAVESSAMGLRANAVGFVDKSGTVQLFCGTAKIAVEAAKASDFAGQLVRVSSGKSGVSLSRLSGGATGDLDVAERTMGGKKLSEQVMIFRDGESISLADLQNGVIPAGQIQYARLNWADRVDLIVLGGGIGSTVYYGRAVVTERENEDGKVISRSITLHYGDKKVIGPYESGYPVSTGDYLAVTLQNKKETGREGFASVTVLTEVKNAPNSAWTGMNAVTVDGRTYAVSAGVPCYNRDTGKWMSLKEAHAYAAQSTLYVSDGVVRVIEVRG